MWTIGSLKFMASHPLTRGAPLRNLGRFVRWQVGSRLAPGAIVFEWINGSKFIVRQGETGLTGNVYAGLHEFPEMGYLLHVLRPDDLFVDVGANVGAYTILACAALGARGCAFEPVPNTYRRLMDNIRLNDIDARVRCLNVGVGRKSGEACFTVDMDTANHIAPAAGSAGQLIRVAIRTLDESLQGESPAVMKIDVEGYEAPALAGAEATLRDAALHSIIMELNGSGNRYGYDESAILDCLFDHGFRSYSYDPLERRLTQLPGRKSGSDNTIFIRDPARVAQRLASSGQVEIFGRRF